LAEIREFTRNSTDRCPPDPRQIKDFGPFGPKCQIDLTSPLSPRNVLPVAQSCGDKPEGFPGSSVANQNL
jgi:hypothetical protein